MSNYPKPGGPDPAPFKPTAGGPVKPTGGEEPFNGPIGPL